MNLLVVCNDLSSEKLDIVFLFNLDYPDVDRVKILFTMYCFAS
jgi:hypothetical protein